MIRLICIDVDGTLVGSSGTVLPRVWEAADRTRARGLHIAICSGRPPFGVTRQLADRLDHEGWHIFQNGASVMHLAAGRSLSTPIPPATLALLVERSRRTGRVLELYTDTAYGVELDTPRARQHAGLLGVPFGRRSFDTLPERVIRAQWLLDLDDLPALLAEPHPGLTVSPSTSPMMPDTAFVNVTPAGVDKGSAVRRVAAELDIPLEQVMFVGDGHNDVVAMRIVGYPVAMANAEPEVHEVARAAVAHVDEEGLVDAFELALTA